MLRSFYSTVRLLVVSLLGVGMSRNKHSRQKLLDDPNMIGEVSSPSRCSLPKAVLMLKDLHVLRVMS